ncbi:MAG: peptide-N-glycosidase F-related protein, partial [Holophagae bacterium]
MRKAAAVLWVLATAPTLAVASESSHRLIVPAAAHTDGADGSVWRTDLLVHNPSDRAVESFVRFIPTGARFGGGVIVPFMSVSLGPKQTRVVGDVLSDPSLPPGGATGALIVEGRDLDGLPAVVVVDSRTWNVNQIGSYGQGIPAVAWARDGDLAERERIILDLESSEDFRTNLGLVNPTVSLEQTFLIEILDPSGVVAGRTYVQLGPLSHAQLNNLLAKLGLDGSGFTARVRLTRWEEVNGGAGSTPEPPDFVVYGSKVDRRSNDPTYLAALLRTSQAGLPKHRIIPAAARTEGAHGSSWQTDLLVHSAGDSGVTALVVELVPTGGQGIGTGSAERVITSISRGQTKSFEDIVGTSFPDHELAALVIEGLAGGGSPDLRVMSRTWTPTGDGGATMGQGIPGIPRGSLADPVVIAGLESTDAFRSNLGLVNPSTNIRADLEVTVTSADGVVEGVLPVTLEPWSHLQIDSVLDELELDGAGHAAVVALTGSENLMFRPSESWDPVFFAYGSRIDRATNDPTYIEGVRLTPEPPGGRGDWVDFNADEPWYRCPDEPFADEATVVRAFDRAEHWFGAENHRSVVHEVDFPPAGDWNQVGLRLHLECPESGLCDHWDRTGSLQLVLNPEDPEEEWEYLEIMRHITPYRVGMCEFVDITPLAPLLTGRQTLVSWIDTWVGPGHSDGDGWRITWDFVFYPGEDRTADEVVNIWGRRSIEVGNLEPDHTVDAQTEPVEVAVPADATRVEARLIATGHSFGNALNCAEFCVMRQDLLVDGERRSVVPWRTDCEHNPVNDQQGTWQYDRNGWCPGAITIGDTIDITDLVTPGGTA